MGSCSLRPIAPLHFGLGSLIYDTFRPPCPQAEDSPHTSALPAPPGSSRVRLPQVSTIHSDPSAVAWLFQGLGFAGGGIPPPPGSLLGPLLAGPAQLGQPEDPLPFLPPRSPVRVASDPPGDPKVQERGRVGTGKGKGSQGGQVRGPSGQAVLPGSSGEGPLWGSHCSSPFRAGQCSFPRESLATRVGAPVRSQNPKVPLGKAARDSDNEF